MRGEMVLVRLCLRFQGFLLVLLSRYSAYLVQDLAELAAGYLEGFSCSAIAGQRSNKVSTARPPKVF